MDKPMGQMTFDEIAFGLFWRGACILIGASLISAIISFIG